MIKNDQFDRDTKIKAKFALNEHNRQTVKDENGFIEKDLQEEKIIQLQYKIESREIDGQIKYQKTLDTK